MSYHSMTETHTHTHTIFQCTNTVYTGVMLGTHSFDDHYQLTLQLNYIVLTSHSQIMSRDNMEVIRVTLLNLNSVLLFHVWQTDTLDGVLSDHYQVLGTPRAAMVTAFVVHIEEVVVTVNDAREDGGVVSSLVELFV